MPNFTSDHQRDAASIPSHATDDRFHKLFPNHQTYAIVQLSHDMQPAQIRFMAMKLIQNRDFNAAIPVLDSLVLAVDEPIASDIAWRAKMYFATARYELAKSDYLRVLELEHKNQMARHCLAIIFAAAPEDHLRDGPTGLRLIRGLLSELDGLAWNPMSVAAACHAECADFDAATQLIQQVIEIAPKEMNNRFNGRLAQYKNREPYRLNSADTVQQMLNDPLVCLSCGASSFFLTATPEDNRIPICVECAKQNAIINLQSDVR